MFTKIIISFTSDLHCSTYSDIFTNLIKCRQSLVINQSSGITELPDILLFVYFVRNKGNKAMVMVIKQQQDVTPIFDQFYDD